MVELVGKASITCSTTGYRADIVFKDAACYRNHAAMNRVEGIVQLGNERVGSLEGVWDGEVTMRHTDGLCAGAGTQQTKTTTLLNNDSGFRKHRLRRRLVPLQQQHKLSPDGACDKFFDSEVASKARNAAYANGDDTKGHTLTRALFAAAKQRKVVNPAPAFFDVEEVDDIPGWCYKHADGQRRSVLV